MVGFPDGNSFAPARGVLLDGAWTVMNGLCDCRFIDVDARSNGERYRVFVGGPGKRFFNDAEDASQRFPAVYVLDGKLNFALVHAQAQTLAALGQLPPLYVIGVGYAGDETFFERDVFRRQGDLTPDAGGEAGAEMQAMNRAQGVTLGGAGAFLTFLAAELRPALEAKFAIDRNDATLLGNSLGGLFPSWVLFHRPDLFKRYVIVSPSWWWNAGVMWDWEAAYAATHADLSAKVFAAFGGLETLDRHRRILVEHMSKAQGDARAAMEKTLARFDAGHGMKGAELIPEFAARLAARGYPGLDLKTVVFPDETHESVPGAAFSRGLRAVFGAWPAA